MRASVIHVAVLGVVLLGGVALLPAAAGLVPSSGGCVPFCEVPSHTTAGFLPPVTLVASGSTVTWSTLDSVHTASEETDLCFHVNYGVGDPGSATFVAEGGTLYASEGGGEFEACTTATALADGSLAIPYVCFYHPNTMNGMIVVK